MMVNSTLGGCDRHISDRPSEQTLDAVPGVQTCSDLQMCACHVRAGAPFTTTFDQTIGKGHCGHLGVLVGR